ncbi:hypothetical protein FSP39_020912, partial [Pinctada imbricata]
GKRFVMVFPPMFYDQGVVYTKLYLATKFSNVTCNVSVPNHDTSHTYVLTDGFTEIQMDKVLMPEENKRGDYGVEITASEDITVYGIKRDFFTRTAFLVLPYKSLSNQYLITSVKPMPYKNGWRIYNSTISIVSATDKNYVNIKLKVDGTIQHGGKSYGNGEFIRITLNKYEHYVLSSHEHDLTGTLVTSVDPVAVSTGNTCGRLHDGYACSGLYTMTPPTSSLQKTFIVPPLQSQPHGFNTRIVAASDLTRLTVHYRGQEQQVDLNKQEYYDVRCNESKPVYIESNFGVIVSQMTPGKNNEDGAGAAFMMYVPAVSQYKTQYNFFVPGEELSSLISVIARDISKIQLDNNIIRVNSNDIQTVEANEGEFQIAEIKISSGYHVITDTDGRTFSVFVHGKKQPSLGYGYNIGYYLLDGSQ